MTAAKAGATGLIRAILRSITIVCRRQTASLNAYSSIGGARPGLEQRGCGVPTIPE
jgi:hypothetical protein